MTDKPAQIKTHIEDIRRDLSTHTNKFAIMQNDIDALRATVNTLRAEKDGCAKIKESYTKFSEKFNTNMRSLDERVTSTEDLSSSKVEMCCKKIEELNSSLLSKLVKIEQDLETVKASIEF